MRKFLALTFLFFSMNLFLSAEGMHWNFMPYTKIRYGQQNEYVFCNSKLDKNHKLSELNWEQKPVFFWGIDGNVSWHGFSFGMNFQKSFSHESGIVKDSDWLNKDTFNKTYASYKTNYSENDCILDGAYVVETTISYDFTPVEWLSIGPVSKLQYEYSFFKAKGGWYQYASENFQPYEKYETGEKKSISSDSVALTLERSYYFLWTGLASSVNIGEKFSASAGFLLCPYALVDSIDSHVIAKKYYLDHMEGKFMAYKVLLDMQYFLTRHQSVCFSFSYLDTDILTGNTRTSGDSPDGSYGLALGKAGSSFNFVDFSLGYRICF